jgi:hypothetical protein
MSRIVIVTLIYHRHKPMDSIKLLNKGTSFSSVRNKRLGSGSKRMVQEVLTAMVLSILETKSMELRSS